MGESHYYDNMTFSRILKRTATIKRPSDGEDVSYNNSSVIYRYDHTWTPLAPEGSDYWKTIDNSYVTLKNQILSISGEPITVGYGKNVDVSVNIHENGKNTYNTTDITISGVPFLGNQSVQTINSETMEVLDLFEYIITGYTITTTSLDPNIDYTVMYNDWDNTYVTIFPAVFKQFSYDDAIGQWYISDPLSDPPILCSDPVPIYGYSRIHAYSYPETNVNNIVTDRYNGYDPATQKMIPNMISDKIELPQLP